MTIDFYLVLCYNIPEKTTKAGKMKMHSDFDFLMNFNADKPFKILHLTDIQTIDITATRNPTRDRQIKGAYFKDGITDMEIRAYRDIKALVERSKPDLIVLTGDNVYGEFDDNGKMWSEFVELMDSFKIPWAPVFGNHDNESEIGVRAQIKRLTESEFCLFSRGNVTGNSNYSIALSLAEEVKWILLCLDTNGCHPVGNPNAPEEGIRETNRDIEMITQRADIYPDQIQWASKTLDGADAPSLAFFHIPIHAFADACREKYGYQKGVPMNADAPGDQGRVIENFSDELDRENIFFDAMRERGMKGMFVGHQHNNFAVINWKGVKLVWGVKTGKCTYFVPGQTGGCEICLYPCGELDITPIYI